MCQEAPGTRRRTGVPVAVALLAAAMAASAQSQALPVSRLRLDWRRIGTSGYEAGLASAATGPVARVWFTERGQRLHVRTASGRVFSSTGMDPWTGADRAQPPPEADPEFAAPARPEPAAVVRSGDSFHARLYAYGQHVYRSDDGGEHWTNLTKYRGGSILGGGVTDLAVSPADPDVVVAANPFGVWRSADGGLSWMGLNDTLPNLPVGRILGVPSGVRGTRVALQDGRVVEWAPGEKESWQPVLDASEKSDEAARAGIAAQLGFAVTALALSEGRSYAGTEDGRIWASDNGGTVWYAGRDLEGRPAALAAASANPGVVFAAVSTTAEGGGSRVLQSSDGGASWDDVTGDLPAGGIRGLATDSAGTALYAASSAGVYFKMLGARPSGWILMSDGMAPAPAADVKLDGGGNQVYAAMEGFGVYAAPAPHRFWSVKVVNSADFSERPAAPGSLLTVLGGRLLRAQAGFREFPILHATDGEAQIQVPFEIAGTTAQLALETARGNVALSVPMLDVSPAIFVDREGGALLLDGATGTLLDGANPARRGSRVQILATGLGQVTPRWPTGTVAPLEEPPKVDAEVRAYVDRSAVEVLRATLAPGYVGFYLVEVRMPEIVNGGAAELYLSAGQRESNRVRIDLEP